MFNLDGAGLTITNGLSNGILPALKRGNNTEAAFQLMQTQNEFKKEQERINYQMSKEVVGWNIFSDSNSKIGGLLTQLAKS